MCSEQVETICSKALQPMETTDSQAKQAAVDNKSAFAGAGSEKRDEGLSIDQLGTNAGLNVRPEVPLSTAKDLHRRDEERAELDIDAK